MSFRVIVPVEITDTILTSSTVPEPDAGETAWSAVTTYALGDRRYVASNHVMYESLIAGNLNNDPTLEVQNDPDNPPTKWLQVGMTNRWQALDILRNTKSTDTSPMTIVLSPGVRIDSFGAFGLEADSITVTLTKGGTTYYTNTVDLKTREVTNWYDYFYLPFEFQPSVVAFDLPPVSGATFTVTLTSSTGTVSMSALVIGPHVNIGDVQYGAESDVLNFSVIDRAFDGTAQLLPRRSIPKIIATVMADKSLTNKIRKLRKTLNAVPAVWAGIDQTDDDYFESLLILGVYKKFSINLDHPTAIIVNAEIEEI